MGNGSDLRVALIGTGIMGEDHARRISHRIPNTSLAAVCDIDLERAEHSGVPSKQRRYRRDSKQ